MSPMVVTFAGKSDPQSAPATLSLAEANLVLAGRETEIEAAVTRLVDWARSFPGQDRKRHGVLLLKMKHARIGGGAPADAGNSQTGITF